MTTTTIITRLTRNLTGHELFRLLNRRDLHPLVAEAIWYDEAQEADYYAERAGEQLAETGRAIRYQTRLEAYLNAHPEHGPQAPCDDCHVLPCTCVDDIPF